VALEVPHGTTIIAVTCDEGVAVTADGFRQLSEAQSEEYVRADTDHRLTSPDGPRAPLRQPDGDAPAA